MDDKATSNYEAAKLLLEKSFFDSSASRAYYAAYMKACHYLDIIGIPPPIDGIGRVRNWKHYDFATKLHYNHDVITSFQMRKWERLYSKRVRADYYPDGIKEEEARNSVIIAFEFLEHFTNEERIYETRD
ncbi:MAG: HEPN domain-containing protein [Deltaproteobacteria bacterium]|nr:HEPN domain-containing protein [Deltaproteobacteria bacterium]